jgi:signal transduction histidine kinase
MSEDVTQLEKRLEELPTGDKGTVEEVDLLNELASTLNLMEHDFGRRVQVVRDFGSIPLVRCNPGEMNQVFMNLLTNARQAIDENGAITVRTFEKSPNVCIQISDTGSVSPRSTWTVCSTRRSERKEPG